MLKNKFISVVIVAAGASTRMNSTISKQLMTYGGKTVLEHTVAAFKNSGIVDEIIIVCPAKDIESFKNLFGNSTFDIPLKFTAGGSTRQQSVGCGINDLDERCDIIAVHDGARPLVRREDIRNVVDDAIRFGAATLAVPVKDTIKLVENKTVESTPPRDKLFIIQTPQVFDKNTYLKAYKKALEDGKEFTDDCQLIESVGGKVHITTGDYTNIKITTIEDISIAEAFWQCSNEATHN